jgi:hypothetical protein
MMASVLPPVSCCPRITDSSANPEPLPASLRASFFGLCCGLDAYSGSSLKQEVNPLNITLLISCSLALLLAVAALVREVRLRRALQALLARILARWRQYVASKTSSDDDSVGDNH